VSDVQIGMAAALEQFSPRESIRLAALAEQHGFSGQMAADHFQPWVPAQGEASFVWSVLASLAENTAGDLGPGVTCPSFRFHPSMVAQAAATLGASSWQAFRRVTLPSIRWGVAYGVVLMLLMYLGVWFWLRETAAGRHVYAVGNNPEATRLTGIATERVLLGVYVLAGVFYGIAALLSALAEAATSATSSSVTSSITSTS